MTPTEYQAALIEVLQKYGSTSIEYRRLHRRYYRQGLRRIDYIPSRRALAAIERAISSGWALGMSDAIDQAVVDYWSDSQPE